MECQNANIPYGPILSVSHSAGSALSHSIVDASIYHSPPSVYSPVKCGYSDMRSAIQMRLVVKEHNGTRGSLMQIAQTR